MTDRVRTPDYLEGYEVGRFDNLQAELDESLFIRNNPHPLDDKPSKIKGKVIYNIGHLERCLLEGEAHCSNLVSQIGGRRNYCWEMKFYSEIPDTLVQLCSESYRKNPNRRGILQGEKEDEVVRHQLVLTRKILDGLHEHILTLVG